MRCSSPRSTGALCGLIGVYVVLRGMSYIGHGLSHAIFGGAVASYIVGINVFLGAGLWGLVAALFINRSRAGARSAPTPRSVRSRRRLRGRASS